ncbi:MAG: S8 family serine peptidase [Betaproteobacteria bacterium]|nr:S8 family serine peptidase [Betaproteobacteria bacterium]
MAVNQVRRFIILPTRGFVATETTGDEALNALYKLQNPGVMAFTRVAVSFGERASTPFKVKVLASLHENGPKLVEMTETEAFAMRMNSPGLRVVPEVRYQIARAPRVAVTAGKKAFPSATLGKLKLSIVTKAGGAPVSDVHVIAFTNFAKRIGAEGHTNSKGQVSLSLPLTTKKLERVYCYAEHTAWPTILAGLQVSTKPVALPNINLNFADSRVKACAPFDPEDGKAVKVGVLDTGVGPHDALVVAKGVCAVFGDADQDFTDSHGHGTHVAGVIAAKAANFIGIAPAVTLHAYRVFPRAPGAGASNFDIGNAIDLAVADGCDLLNLSLGGGPMDAVTDEAIKAARARGTVCVIAAGNDGGPVANPGRHPLAICISAMGYKGAWPAGATQNDDLTQPLGKDKTYIAAFSNTGPEIDLTGSGCGIISTYPQNRFAVMDGTSMACPCATGAIARRLAKAAAIVGAPRDAARADQILQLAYADAKDLGFPPSRQGAGLRT